MCHDVLFTVFVFSCKFNCFGSYVISYLHDGFLHCRSWGSNPLVERSTIDRREDSYAIPRKTPLVPPLRLGQKVEGLIEKEMASFLYGLGTIGRKFRKVSSQELVYCLSRWKERRDKGHRSLSQ